MAAEILQSALKRLGQEEKFTEFRSYLESEWISTLEDLQHATKDEHVWQSLRIPARLKVEMRLILEQLASNIATPTTTDLVAIDTTSDQLSPSSPHDLSPVGTDHAFGSEWVLYFSEEHQYYYHYNTVTGESQWAVEDDYDTVVDEIAQIDVDASLPPAPPYTSTSAVRTSDGHNPEFIFPKGYSRSESMHRQQVRRSRRDQRHRVIVHREDVASSSEDEEESESGRLRRRAEAIREDGGDYDSDDRSDSDEDSSYSDDDRDEVTWSKDDINDEETCSNASEYFIVNEDVDGVQCQVEKYRIPHDTSPSYIDPSAPPLPPLLQPTIAHPPASPQSMPPKSPFVPPPGVVSKSSPINQPPIASGHPPTPPVPPPSNSSRPKIGKALNKIFRIDVDRIIGRSAATPGASTVSSSSPSQTASTER